MCFYPMSNNVMNETLDLRQYAYGSSLHFCHLRHIGLSHFDVNQCLNS